MRNGLGFRAEGGQAVGVGFEAGGTDEVEAVGDGGENGFKVFADGFGAAGEVNDEGAAADAGGLPGEDGGGHVAQGRGAHELAEAGEHFLADGGGGFGGDVAGGGTGAAGGDDEGAGEVIGEVDELGFDAGLFVGDDGVGGLKGRDEPLAEESEAGLAGLVGIDAGGGAVGDVEDAEAERGGHGEERGEKRGARGDRIQERREGTRGNWARIWEGVVPWARRVVRLRASWRLARRWPVGSMRRGAWA